MFLVVTTTIYIYNHILAIHDKSRLLSHLQTTLVCYLSKIKSPDQAGRSSLIWTHSF